MTNAKLTKTQQEVLDGAIRYVNEARAMEFEDWAIRSGIHETFDGYLTWLTRHYDSEAVERIMRANRDEHHEARDGIAVIRADTRTLKALEKKGCIKIIEIGGAWFDKVEVLGM